MTLFQILAPLFAMGVALICADKVLDNSCELTFTTEDTMYPLLRRVPHQFPNVGLRIQIKDGSTSSRIIDALSDIGCLSVNVTRAPLKDSVELREYLKSVAWEHPSRVLIITDVDKWGNDAKDALKGLIEDGEAGAEYVPDPILVLLMMRGSRADASRILPDRVVHKLSEVNV